MHAEQSIFREDKTKPFLICFGQDEVIFKQFLMNKKCWYGPNSEFWVRPKDDGSGIMISGFQLYEFGFGFPNFESNKQNINAYRKNKFYHDKEAAATIKKNHKKSDLLEDPFVRFFEYGNVEGKEGYWTYEHMVLQLEDCLDVLYSIHKNKYSYLFLFDHSCGHDRMPKDAINVNNMNVAYGGKKEIFHDTNITQAEGFLGPFIYDEGDQLKVGDK